MCLVSNIEEREAVMVEWFQREAIMQSSVSSRTDLLVVGENPGGVKVTKANQLSIPICYESDFFDKFGRQLSIKS